MGSIPVAGAKKTQPDFSVWVFCICKGESNPSPKCSAFWIGCVVHGLPFRIETFRARHLPVAGVLHS